MPNKLFDSLHSVADIVDTMIKGLEREWVEIDMNTFGEDVDGTCIGCAATNTLCELMGEPFREDTIRCLTERANQVNHGITSIELSKFEVAIDSLRKGFLYSFIFNLNRIKYLFSFQIPEELHYYKVLPTLQTFNWKEEIGAYKEFRDWLRKEGI